MKILLECKDWLAWKDRLGVESEISDIVEKEDEFLIIINKIS